MELEEQAYFEKKINYKSRVKSIYSENQQDIDYFSTRVRNFAKDALNNEISPKNAKKEISELIKTINNLKDKIK